MSTSSTARSRSRAQDSLRYEVVDLNIGPPVVGGGNQHEALFTGTRTAPIDVEALGDERRNRRSRRPLLVVDLELDTNQEGADDTGTSRRKRQRDPPVVCLSPDREERDSIKRAKAAPKELVFTCPVCLNKLEQPCTTNCGHIFCEECIKLSIKAQKKCPTCRKKLGTRSYHRVYLPTAVEQGC